MFNKTLVGFFSLLLCLSSFIVNASQLEDIKTSGVIKVAVPQDFPPFGFVSTDMSLQGYDIDMAEYIAKSMGVRLELVPVTSANRVPYLQTRKVDLIISSLGKNAERQRAIDFSAAYAPFFLGVFGKEGVDVSSVEGLSGQVVGVTRGSVEDIELSKLAGKDVTIRRFEDNNTTISAYVSGQVDLIATGNVIASEIATKFPKRHPETKFAIKNSPCFIGVRKGQKSLLTEVNSLIQQAYTEGKLNDMSVNWLKLPLPADLAS
ncbi:transporter substrate-binding domain-containing protein [Photobacterium sp. DNB23_23_1]|uniref:Transporter substrate-binding domain-containing protein n=1 Tax=Photobacterium pectinilyticum TaxID=2906793 RepID=A0ABT1N880_9GAMM|nr:transporter substrate-binding domain-containing protein [Photobacterium sp. ZSDE20]MCQ1060938.1 transporter substrate-binding domain-containing protein [Photobacterium sp. ZSDE20]MDD1828841.1 transporter substrate-binding domain-containing protein [Photobacterium sp. ZSDE20]